VCGPDMDAAKLWANRLGLDMPSHGPLDRSELAYTHEIFVNPSRSDVLCKTSADSLAMGSFVIPEVLNVRDDGRIRWELVLRHDTFTGTTVGAMTHSPVPLD
jgi:digalactosyldiacylglycerol synthase